jgi:hypothetical protein
MTNLLANQAFDTALTALLTACGVFLAAMAGYLKVRTQQAAQGAKLDAVASQLKGGGAPTTIVAVPPAAGAGRAPLAAPAWNQLNDVLPDGQQDPYATSDCGEESVAMALYACGGPNLPAGVLRMLLGGPGRAGTTTAAELAYLLALFGVKAHVRQADPDAAWTEWQHSYQARYLAIALGYWVSPGFLHWVLVREADEGHLTFNDPWGGQVRTLEKQEAQKLYGGVYVHVDQQVSAPAPGPPHA